MKETSESRQAHASRREFLRTSAAVAAGAAALTLPSLPRAYAAGNDEIRVGLVGCGGRGKGAVANACSSSENVKLVAVADVFKDKAAQAAEQLKKLGPVDPGHIFDGLDSHAKLFALPEVNYVILATPPGFRSQHIKAAIKAGKNIFAEKPVAVDGPTARECFEAAEEGAQKKIAIGTGTQRHHKFSYLETIKRLQDGAIGEIISGRVFWNHGGLWSVPKGQLKDLEWQLRNWMYFTWLSGDHIVEQHVHNIDVANWLLKEHPKRALALGGRQVRTDPQFGCIYDHFATEFEYPNNVFVTSFCRQQENTDQGVGEWFYGTKGRASAEGLILTGADKWQWGAANEDEKGGPYVQEHRDLIASIRKGEPLNELKAITESTLTGIMGRMSAYTGKYVTWKQALESPERLMPPNLDLNMVLPVPPVAMPGKTKLL